MSSVNIPGQWDLYSFTGLPDIYHWKPGIEANNRWSIAYKEYKRKSSSYHATSVAFSIIGIFLVASSSLLTAFAGILLFIASFLLSRRGPFFNAALDKNSRAQNHFTNVSYQHTDTFIQPLVNYFNLGPWRSFRVKRECIIYNQDIVIYFDADNSLLVVYNRDCIKEVSRERVHTGSHSTGSSNSFGVAYANGNTGNAVGTAYTNSEINSTDNYEWHFDLLTNFMNHPRVSFVLPDSPQAENFVKEACGILQK